MQVHDVLGDIGCVLEAKHLLDDALGLLVAGMGLAGQHELDGLGPGEQRERAAGIVGEQPDPLVGCGAPREPDRERVRVKRAGGCLDPRARLALGEPVDPAAFLDELHQL